MTIIEKRSGHTYPNSDEAIAGSRRLLEDVKNGLIHIDRLPNTAEDFQVTPQEIELMLEAFETGKKLGSSMAQIEHIEQNKIIVD